jgi:hypothetical protein
MSNSKDTKQRLMLLAALAAPVVIVQVMRGVLGAGAMPAASHAAPMSADPAPADAGAPAAPVSPAEAKARGRVAAWLAELPDNSERLASLRSPMDQVPAPTVVTPAAPQGPEPAEPAPVVRTSPDGPRGPMVLGTILNTSRGAIAAINGQVLRIGEEVEPGWVLVGVNLEARSATVQGPKGQTILLSR